MGLETLAINGKFMGLWAPATKCKCWCGRMLSLSGGLWWLAVYQIVFAAGSLIGKIITSASGSYPYEMSAPIVELGLGIWMMRGVQQIDKEPVLHFSFVQILLAVKASLDCFIGTIYSLSKIANNDENSSLIVVGTIFTLLYYYFTIPTKVMSSFIAWSFVVENFPDEYEALPKTDSAKPSKVHLMVLRAEDIIFASDKAATLRKGAVFSDQKLPVSLRSMEGGRYGELSSPMMSGSSALDDDPTPVPREVTRFSRASASLERPPPSSSDGVIADSEATTLTGPEGII